MPQYNNVFICSTKLLTKEMATETRMINYKSDHDLKNIFKVDQGTMWTCKIL